MFSRGEPNILINSCSDYWNGTKVTPINLEFLQSVKDIISQWNLNDLDAIAFSYKPAIPLMHSYIQDKLYEKVLNKKRVDLLKRQQSNQIFLGMVGIKQHSRREVNEIFK
jgi:magnesium-transporting ATPase (P-type)